MPKTQIRNPLHKVSGFSAILIDNNLTIILEEITPPILKRTLKICTEKTNVSTVKKNYECVDREDVEIAYKNRSPKSTEYYCPTSFSLSVQDTLEDTPKNMVKRKFVMNNNTVNLIKILYYIIYYTFQKNEEIPPSSLEEKWINMTENEKNQWIKKYLYRIKVIQYSTHI